MLEETASNTQYDWGLGFHVTWPSSAHEVSSCYRMTRLTKQEGELGRGKREGRKGKEKQWEKREKMKIQASVSVERKRS